MKKHLLLTFLLLAATRLFAQSPGPLTPPPGPIGPTMKSLEQIEPGTPLDPAQFPATGYVIAQPGSYYLIGNVSAIVATEAAISINASDVTLDLRGFSLIAASGSGTSSADSAILIGAGQSNVTVRDGTIVGAWYAGVFSSSPDCTVRSVRVQRTNTYGIRLVDGAQVSECYVEGSGVTGGTSGTISLTGISVGLRGLVKSCTATQCAGDGISAGSYSAVLDCAAHDNGADGIQSFNGAVIARAAASRNSGRGVLGLDGCAISQCSSANNGAAGISGDAGCTVSRSTGSQNGTSGLIFAEYTALGDCTAANNAGEGIITEFGCALQLLRRQQRQRWLPRRQRQRDPQLRRTDKWKRCGEHCGGRF